MIDLYISKHNAYLTSYLVNMANVSMDCNQILRDSAIWDSISGTRVKIIKAAKACEIMNG